MKIVTVTAVSPSGSWHDIHGGELHVDRYGRDSTMVDIRDASLPKDNDGLAPLIAQVPTSWLLRIVRR